MPWIEAGLRGQRVLARVRSDGKLDATQGRVEIRYRPNDPKAYRAAQQNLVIAPNAKVLPDSAVVEGEAVPSARARRTTSRASSPTPVDRGSASHPVAATSGASPVWTAYTDGACSGNPGPAGAGMVVIAPGGAIHEGYEYLGMATNNVAELTAILRGLESIPFKAPSAVIYTDSRYAIGVLTLGWKAKANGGLIQTTRDTLRGRNVRLLYVPGHAGVPLNERADELAREAIRAERTRPLPRWSDEPEGQPKTA